MPGRSKRMRYAFADEAHRSARSQQPVYAWKRSWMTPAQTSDEDTSSPYKVFKWVKTGQTVIHEDDEPEVESAPVPDVESGAGSVENPERVDEQDSVPEVSAIDAAVAAVEAVAETVYHGSGAVETPGSVPEAASKVSTPAINTADEPAVASGDNAGVLKEALASGDNTMPELSDVPARNSTDVPELSDDVPAQDNAMPRELSPDAPVRDNAPPIEQVEASVTLSSLSATESSNVPDLSAKVNIEDRSEALELSPVVESAMEPAIAATIDPAMEPKVNILATEPTSTNNNNAA
ncbi:hypothetical protein IW147_003559 [Coemansia sp. RSA 720]|nr:hypothetical protein IW147_003559 [Coemansia sp. RSA 720]